MPEVSLSSLDPVPLDRERDRPHPLQVQGWRAMGAVKRTQLGIALRRQTRRRKLEALRAQHPDWPEARVRAELAAIYLRGRT